MVAATVYDTGTRAVFGPCESSPCGSSDRVRYRDSSSVWPYEASPCGASDRIYRAVMCSGQSLVCPGIRPTCHVSKKELSLSRN